MQYLVIDTAVQEYMPERISRTNRHQYEHRQRKKAAPNEELVLYLNNKMFSILLNCPYLQQTRQQTSKVIPRISVPPPHIHTVSFPPVGCGMWSSSFYSFYIDLSLSIICIKNFLVELLVFPTMIPSSWRGLFLILVATSHDACGEIININTVCGLWRAGLFISCASICQNAPSCRQPTMRSVRVMWAKYLFSGDQNQIKYTQ